MESTSRPTPEMAREQLRAVSRAEAAVESASVPLWLILANAVLLPLAVLSQLADDYAIPFAAVAVPAVAIFNGVAVNRLGVVRRVGGSSGSWGGLALVVLLVAVMAASFGLYRSTGRADLVVAAAVLQGVIVLAAGFAHRRATQREAA